MDFHAHHHDKTEEAEIGDQKLGLTRYHADLAPLLGLLHDGPCSPLKVTKLLTSYEDMQSARTFNTLATDIIYNISFIQQCLWLLRTLNSEQILHNCLENPDSATSVIKSARNTIIRQDWVNPVHLAESHLSLKHNNTLTILHRAGIMSGTLT